MANMMGNYALQAVEHDMVGIALSNGAPMVAPWGGRDPFFGTNPVAIGVPAANQPPILIDMSAGSFSAGKTIEAIKAGGKAASPHLVDREGRYTDDTRKINLDWNHMPVGGSLVAHGPRGYGWTIFVEIIGGLLSGARASYENTVFPLESASWEFGQFFMAIDPARLGLLDAFLDDVDRFVGTLVSGAPAVGFESVTVHGQKAHALEEARRKGGVPLLREDFEWFENVCAGLNVPL